MTLDWNAALQAVVAHPLFGVSLTLLAYQIALSLYEKTKWVIFQPVLVSCVIIISILVTFNIDYAAYKEGTFLLSVLLGPATVALAIPLYLNLKRIRQLFWPTIFTLLIGGSLATVLGVGLAWFFGAEPFILSTMAPKSVTSPIAMLVADEIGGSASLAAVFVMITGIVGAMVGVELLRLFNVTHPAAVGLTMGITAHAVGTARSLQEGEEQGAFAALAMSIMGLLTAVLMPLVYMLIS
ncbi:LrgB family protein [Thiopseudomonas alkaliphila]|uniref:LrgB family protein n=1 Tax=Thiopseudomonas alkaliphila TaxID=1697053 RepID=UPI0025772DB8|nr:LrgB family protein [Thiopseudomonas alkaliphila]MDM1715956.1 LrgB family protein [Thiopseudomonas alkaliphila]